MSGVVDVKMKRKEFLQSFFLAFIFTLAVYDLRSQSAEGSEFLAPPAQGIVCRAEVVDGDTIPVIDLYSVDVSTNMVFKTRRQYEMWTRTKYNVKVVYPYAILAGAKLKEYDKALAKIENENLRKAFLKACEKDLRKEFEHDLKNLSVTQGRILMKLIDRESGKTAYEIVEQLRGHFQAVMWNALARLFGNDMKEGYDPEEDMMIENAIKVVERGSI
jgi:hypothetical protein